MLPPESRLRSRSDFRLAIRRGRRLRADGLIAHYAAPVDSAPPRVAVVVGRSLGPAVTRNRLRRRLRHDVRRHLTRLPAGSRLVLRAQPGAGQLTGDALRREVAALIGQVVR